MLFIFHGKGNEALAPPFFQRQHRLVLSPLSTRHSAAKKTRDGFAIFSDNGGVDALEQKRVIIIINLYSQATLERHARFKHWHLVVLRLVVTRFGGSEIVVLQMHERTCADTCWSEYLMSSVSIGTKIGAC